MSPKRNPLKLNKLQRRTLAQALAGDPAVLTARSLDYTLPAWAAVSSPPPVTERRPGNPHV